MSYTHIIDGCFAAKIGACGVPSKTFERWQNDAAAAFGDIRNSDKREMLAVLRGPFLRDDLAKLRQTADRLCTDCSDILIVGTGGSSLGARTLTAIRRTHKPRLHYLENVDPESTKLLLTSLDPEKTGAVFISKSGGTLETLSLAMIVLNWLGTSSFISGNPNRTALITEDKNSPLMKLANECHIPILPFNPDIGGRFSVFSAAGLLPAMLAGLDPIAVRQGAESVVDGTYRNPSEAAATKGAAVIAALTAECGVSISILMTYRDQLSELGLWYRQLWAESLGKAGNGTTPVHATGTVDQHSQLQLYLDGPHDKLVTLVTCPAKLSKPRIPSHLALKMGCDYLANLPLGEILDTSFIATSDTLAQNGRPAREIYVEHIDEFTLGSLLMHFTLETLISAQLWKVNPFGQPAVENGKSLAILRLIDKKREAQ